MHVDQGEAGLEPLIYINGEDDALLLVHLQGINKKQEKVVWEGESGDDHTATLQLARCTAAGTSVKGADGLVSSINAILLTNLTSLGHLHDEVWKLFPHLHQKDGNEEDNKSEKEYHEEDNTSEKEYHDVDQDVDGSGGGDVGDLGGGVGEDVGLVPPDSGVSGMVGGKFGSPIVVPSHTAHPPLPETPKSANTIVSGSSRDSPARVHPTTPSKETTSDIVSSTSPHPTEAVKFTPQMTTTSSSG